MGDFKRLTVWQETHSLLLAIYRSTEAFPKSEMFGLTAQVRRAAVSVSSNIAEGTGRKGDREFAHFLRTARGSLAEVECQLIIAKDLKYITYDEWIRLDTLTQVVRRMLTALIESLLADRSRVTSRK
jgi:four helix bundle protein